MNVHHWHSDAALAWIWMVGTAQCAGVVMCSDRHAFYWFPSHVKEAF